MAKNRKRGHSCSLASGCPGVPWCSWHGVQSEGWVFMLWIPSCRAASGQVSLEGQGCGLHTLALAWCQHCHLHALDPPPPVPAPPALTLQALRGSSSAAPLHRSGHCACCPACPPHLLFDPFFFCWSADGSAFPRRPTSFPLSLAVSQGLQLSIYT